MEASMETASDTNDDQQAFDAIEERAQKLIEEGYEPVDSEPGEWLVMTNPATEDTVVVTPDGTRANKT
jgi:hypothetical protein